jgi:ribosome-binding factor A
MVDQQRARRLAVHIREIVAAMLESRVKDPRLGMVTVTDVRLTGDMHDATVYYTVYGDAAEKAATAVALESATGVLRAEVGRQTGVRFTPTIAFVLDEIPDTARQFEELLAATRAADEELRKSRVGAQPAGDPDPYRFSDDEDADDETAGEQTAVPDPDEPIVRRVVD